MNMTMKDVNPQALIVETASKLKALPGLGMPEWARLVKTGPSRERPPQQADWWHLRGASLLRKVYLKNRGVSRLRKEYSTRKNRGHAPEHHFPASGKIVRTLLQQLETEGLVKIKKGKGRVITPQGQKFLDGVSRQMK